MSFGRYNGLLFGVIFLAFAIILTLSFQIEPLEGDLTRVGGYSEQDFGWQKPQLYFEQDRLYDKFDTINEWKKPYDIIVMGDSFSIRPHNSFIDHLVNKTGWTAAQMHHKRFTLDQIVQSEQFQQYPPKLIIYEAVERRLYRRIQSLADVNVDRMQISPVPDTPPDFENNNLKPGSFHLEPQRRNRYYNSFNDRIAETIHTIKTRVTQWLYPDEKTTYIFELKPESPKLFSSNDQNNVLIYADDIKFRNQLERKQDRFFHALKNAKAMVEKNNYTLFVPLIFPDKLTIYADYFQDQEWVDTSMITQIAKKLPMPRLDLVYSELASNGVQDIYLPNDSHTSSYGSEVAADEIIRFLKRQYPDLEIPGTDSPKPLNKHSMP